MRMPGVSLAAVVDPRRVAGALEDDLVLLDDRDRGVVRPSAVPLRQVDLRHRAEADRPQVHDLAARVVHPEAVELLVQRVEPLVERGQTGRVDLGRVERRRGSRSPGRGSACRPRTRRSASSSAMPSLSSHADGAAAEALEDLGDVGRIGLLEHADVRAGELVAEVGDEVAERAEQARARAGRAPGTSP